MRVGFRYLAAVAAVLLAAGAFAFTPPKSRKAIALARLETKSETHLKVESPAFKEGQPLPEQYSQVGRNISPPLKWSGAPKETQAYAVILEDPDAPLTVPFVHWLIYGIPAGVGELPEGLPQKERLDTPQGAVQGHNMAREIGYIGPRPPKGDPPHHYHFQVFALDAVPKLKPGVMLDALLIELQGHVIAKGETVGTFQIP